LRQFEKHNRYEFKEQVRPGGYFGKFKKFPQANPPFLIPIDAHNPKDVLMVSLNQFVQDDASKKIAIGNNYNPRLFGEVLIRVNFHYSLIKVTQTWFW
jgi:hypothetical protein